MDFNLFRLKTFPVEQGVLFKSNEKRKSALETTFTRLTQQESLGKRRRIGSISSLEDSVVFFRFGYEKTRTTEIYDSNNREFRDVLIDEAASANCFIDFELGLLALEKTRKIEGGITRRLANRIVGLLNSAMQPSPLAIFQADEISNPEEFIDTVKSASYILRFFVKFGSPNPADVNELITRPLEEATRRANATHAHAELFGLDLNKEMIEQLARDAAARGSDAGVRYVKGRKKLYRRLRESIAAVEVPVSHSISTDQAKNIWEMIKNKYLEIRRPDNEQ